MADGTIRDDVFSARDGLPVVPIFYRIGLVGADSIGASGLKKNHTWTGHPQRCTIYTTPWCQFQALPWKTRGCTE